MACIKIGDHFSFKKAVDGNFKILVSECRCNSFIIKLKLKKKITIIKSRTMYPITEIDEMSVF